MTLQDFPKSVQAVMRKLADYDAREDEPAQYLCEANRYGKRGRRLKLRCDDAIICMRIGLELSVWRRLGRVCVIDRGSQEIVLEFLWEHYFIDEDGVSHRVYDSMEGMLVRVGVLDGKQEAIEP